MNTTQLKSYAPQARKSFIEAVTSQAARLGISRDQILEANTEGDLLIVSGQAFPRAIADTREALIERVRSNGFHQTMDAIAYTWFNRFMAIRYMELKGYLDHGYRVLSHPDGHARPQILDHATDVDLPGLDRQHVIELKLDGSKDEDLYRFLLKGQCHALHEAMPFLFDSIGSADELLLPANLLHSDSLIRQLVESIDEDLWQDIEIIGWLYQFYISEKKDQVIGKVVKSEDIPAATQLFTPNWIVKYMVQNSLGAQWLATYPQSPLKGQMEYYIEPAEQTDEVNAQLAAITPSQLNPEELTLIDPASGSGHILVEAYELFKAIYLERGYRQRDVPQLILEKNLFGLDIDERAAQLTGFALMMKGRADDRRLFERGVKLNVMALLDSAGFDAEALAKGVALADYGLKPGDLTELKQLFEHATTFGSLIQVPEGLAAKLPAMKKLSESNSQDLFVSEALRRLGPLVQQAELLAAQYDAVVANPPYMGSGGMNASVKKFTKDHFAAAKSDLFACFIERGYTLARDTGHTGMITMQSWMFLSAYQKLRERMLNAKTIRTMAQLGSRAFGSISGEVVQTTTFILRNQPIDGYRPVFFRLLEGDEQAKRIALSSGSGRHDSAAQAMFKGIPGSPIAYWASESVYAAFSGKKFSEVAAAKIGIQSGDNERHYRIWTEIRFHDLHRGITYFHEAEAIDHGWVPLQHGGAGRKWYGNNSSIVDFSNGAAAILRTKNASLRNSESYFKDAVSWNRVNQGKFFARRVGRGFAFDDVSPFAQPEDGDDIGFVTALLGSNSARHFLQIINTGFKTEVGHVNSLPLPRALEKRTEAAKLAEALVGIGETDWDAYERSWDFQSVPLLTASTDPTPTLESSYTTWIAQNRATIAEMKRLEEENNRLFIDAYGLQDELTPDVPIEQITLTVNPAYRYGGKLTEEEQWTRFRQDTMEELVSYAIGCMMGRYSLDAPGLIYAHSGNEGFDPSRYPTFPADDDGIVPLTDTEWFDDDAAHRLVEFISVAWDKSHLEANLTFLADNLSPKKNESSRETLRRYLCDKFFKDHLQTYKKRPIYWLFSSGKQKAFQCLVYLHRYNEGTLARMRAEYVVPLQGKLSSHITKLEGDAVAAGSTTSRRGIEKEISRLEKQQAELVEFDDKLRHYADQRITLDLDDGVKVNYGKFGDLLAEVSKVHGKKPKV